MDALLIENVSKSYASGTRALNDVSLEIGAGMFGLLGPNGAGKSTLMRTIATLQSADSGSIRFGEIDVLRDHHSVRRILGYLPQDYGLYPSMTAESLLDHLAILKGLNDSMTRAETVASLLVQVNLHHARKQRLGTFSGGMRQRFGIAQALLGSPRLIVVDEPTAGLDPAERVRFHNLLSEIGEDRVVILSTHIVEDVSDLCTSMAILCAGTVRLSGAPYDLISSIEGRLWSRVIARKDLEQVSRELDVVSTRLRGGRTIIHVAHDHRPDASFEPVSATLEDLYFSVLPDRSAAA